MGDCDGEYNYDSRKNTLHWTLPVIDHSNKSGSMEFSMGGHPDDFFPINVSFVSKKSYCDIQVSIFQVQSTLVISNLTGPNKKVRVLSSTR